jgi:hypothetical protein
VDEPDESDDDKRRSGYGLLKEKITTNKATNRVTKRGSRGSLAISDMLRGTLVSIGLFVAMTSTIWSHYSHQTSSDESRTKTQLNPKTQIRSLEEVNRRRGLSSNEDFFEYWLSFIPTVSVSVPEGNVGSVPRNLSAGFK